MKSACKVYRNTDGPARFTGAHWPWICETPDGRIYCDSRESARESARAHNQERAALIREGERYQARVEFYDGLPA